MRILFIFFSVVTVIALELIMVDSIKEKNVTTDGKYINKETLITTNLTLKQPPVLQDVSEAITPEK